MNTPGTNPFSLRFFSQLLSAGDFPAALELISSSQQLLFSELSGVSSLVPTGRWLGETKGLIEQTMATELLETALGYEITAGAPVYPTEVKTVCH